MGDKYRPQKGDRVRVVLESTVGYVDSTSSFSTYYNGFRFEQEDLVSVEKIEDPLPTTPGSVIVRYEAPHDKDTPVFVRRSLIGGYWRDVAEARDGGLEPGLRILDHYDVEYDAGKAL